MMERAKQKEGLQMGKNVGFQYRDRIIDAIFNMTGDALEEGAKYELR